MIRHGEYPYPPEDHAPFGLGGGWGRPDIASAIWIDGPLLGQFVGGDWGMGRIILANATVWGSLYPVPPRPHTCIKNGGLRISLHGLRRLRTDSGASVRPSRCSRPYADPGAVSLCSISPRSSRIEPAVGHYSPPRRRYACIYRTRENPIVGLGDDLAYRVPQIQRLRAMAIRFHPPAGGADVLSMSVGAILLRSFGAGWGGGGISARPWPRIAPAFSYRIYISPWVLGSPNCPSPAQAESQIKGMFFMTFCTHARVIYLAMRRRPVCGHQAHADCGPPPVPVPHGGGGPIASLVSMGGEPCSAPLPSERREGGKQSYRL